ncbi:MAG: TRAP transporter substrate-binding protein [Pseudomonadota bacterium]
MMKEGGGKVHRIGAALLALTMAACAPQAEQAGEARQDPPVRWRMAATFSSSLTMLGTLGKRLTERAALVSGGEIELSYMEPGALVPALELFDAVSFGAIEAGWSTPGYWGGKVPALQLFGSVPFGPPADEYLAWFFEGGGRALFEDLYHRHNVHSLICGVSPPEASGWYKEEMTSLADLKGKKIRFFGLGGKVLDRLGVSTQLLSAGDIFPALELGAIDGAEFSMPAVDEAMGFYQAARYYYFPGWHQQSTFFELMVNLKRWRALSARQQAMLETLCGDSIRFSLAEGEALQVAALKRLEARGVVLKTWPPDMLAAFEAAWKEVAAEMAEEDPDFARAWRSLQDFRRQYKGWRSRGYLQR